jgi:resuscitation-promoting factor RpfA
MSGRHRKPTHTGLRLARAGALTVMAMAPLTSITGTALAATPDSDHDSSSTADPDSSGWNDDFHRHDHGDEGTSDRSEPASFDWRDSHSPRSTHHDSEDSRGSDDSPDSDDSRNADDSSGSDDSSSGSDDSPSRSYGSSRDSDGSASNLSDRVSRASTGSTVGSTSTPAAALAKWDNLARCESTANWAANTGNGYSGGLQFTDATWRAYGGNQYASSAHQASRLEQIAVARKVQQAQGWKAWPACSRKLGYS